MSFHVQAAPKQHWGWLCSRVGYAPTPFFQGIEAVSGDGRILGMAGFDFWTPNSAQMLFALDSPVALRALLRPSFEYLFQQLGKKVALAIVSAANARSLAITTGLGFREVHRVREGHSDGVDLVVMEMRADECRYTEKGRAPHA